MLTEVDAHVDGLMTRSGSNESFIQAIRVVIQHVLPDAFHVIPNSLFIGPDPVEPTESHYRTVSLARDHAASTAPHNIHKRYTLRNNESDSESSVEDSICFLPYNVSCLTHNISGPRCALSNIYYLHGVVTRLMVPPSDASPWVPPDASMELQRYNTRKRGIAFSNAPAQGDPKRQDTSSSSSSSSSASPSTSIPPTLPEFTTPLPPVPSTPCDPLTGSLKRWQAAQPLVSDSPYTMPRAQRHRMTPPVGTQRTTNILCLHQLALLHHPAVPPTPSSTHSSSSPNMRDSTRSTSPTRSSSTLVLLALALAAPNVLSALNLSAHPSQSPLHLARP